MRRQHSDAALVEAARAGDRGAFGQLVERHGPMLRALCRRTVSDAHAAEDAAQEAILQALLHLDRLRRPERFGPWLAGIGLNICRGWLQDRWRAHGSWETLYDQCVILEPRNPEPSPAELVQAADLVERVRQAVANLPPGQRAAVALFYLAGLTHAETATQLGIEVGAVKMRLHKARAALRQRLMDVWEDGMVTEISSDAISVEVVDVRRLMGTPAHFVVVREIGGTRTLPLRIGRAADAEAMAVAFERVELPRPLPYDLTVGILQAAGVRLQEVRVESLIDTVFYAVVVVEGPGGVRTVDARPSDAISLALLMQVPIRVQPAVFEAHAAWRATWPLPLPDLFGEGTDGAQRIAAEVQATFQHHARR
jgi:RNA polymerase sigma factor (sigma-70 family)